MPKRPKHQVGVLRPITSRGLRAISRTGRSGGSSFTGRERRGSPAWRFDWSSQNRLHSRLCETRLILTLVSGCFMPALGPERWQALSPYLDQALEMPASQRLTWIETLRSTDPKLAEELQTLIDEHEVLEKGGFLGGAEASILPVPSALAGQVLGAYTLKAPIGQGGMGTVWLARRSDGRFEGRAAAKFLNLALLGRAGRARVQRQGNIPATPRD